MPDVRIEVCDSMWQPLGELERWDALEVTLRVCDVGRGKVDAPATDRNRALVDVGGTVLVHIDEHTYGGLLNPIGEDQPGGPSWQKLSWSDPLDYLAADQAWPNPDTDTGQGSNEFDRRTGYASTVVLGYVAANIGPGNDVSAWRRAPGLVIGRDPQVGAWIDDPVEARYDNLLDLCRTVAMPNGAVFDITTSDRGHLLQIRPMRDLTGDAQFSRALGNLGAGSWSMAPPKATRIIGMGKGEGTARTIVLVSTTESRRQEAAWGRAFVAVHDSSSTEDGALRGECVRKLFELGETVDVTYDLAQAGLRYGTDYLLGDLVSVHPDGMPRAVTKPVREVTQRVSTANGYTVSAVVGDYQATSATGAQFTTKQIIRTVEAFKTRR